MRVLLVEQCARRDPLRAGGGAGDRHLTESFRATGEAMATSWGMPGYRFLDVQHPIANLGDKKLDARADRLAEVVLALLRGER